MRDYLFHTKRLNIRPLHSSDIDAFHALQSNEKVMKYTTGRGMTRTENEADLKKIIAHYNDPNNDFWVWVCESASRPIFVGTCAIVGTEDGRFEIGYRFLEAHWGNGYGLEITEGLIEYAFTKMGLNQLIAYVDEANIYSIRVLEQSRFEFVKSFFNVDYGTQDRLYQVSKS